jgi:pentatricopeptide repeat protein
VISTCEKAGEIEKLHELMEEMKENSITPDIVTYRSKLKACGDDYQAAEACLREMERYFY